MTFSSSERDVDSDLKPGSFWVFCQTGDPDLGTKAGMSGEMPDSTNLWCFADPSRNPHWF